MHVYLSTNPTGDVFSSRWTNGYRKNDDVDLPKFVWDNITFGDWKDSRTVDYDVKLPLVSKSFIIQVETCQIYFDIVCAT